MSGGEWSGKVFPGFYRILFLSGLQDFVVLTLSFLQNLRKYDVLPLEKSSLVTTELKLVMEKSLNSS